MLVVEGEVEVGAEEENGGVVGSEVVEDEGGVDDTKAVADVVVMFVSICFRESALAPGSRVGVVAVGVESSFFSPFSSPTALLSSPKSLLEMVSRLVVSDATDESEVVDGEGDIDGEDEVEEDDTEGELSGS